MKKNTAKPFNARLRNNVWPRCLRISGIVTMLWLIVSCAKMGQPDGGWYDETPPEVVGASPSEGATGVETRKISILFSEYIKIDNPTEKVVVSPPQIEAAEIKGAGKKITVELKDSLKENTTYTIDFSDAISDNNEGNPLGNYTYSFSTGDVIDTLEVAGHVLAAENLEPVKGILVGLYQVTDTTATNGKDTADSIQTGIFRDQPMMRVSRTDSRGRFIIRGVAPGNYRILALQDMDGDYKFSQKGEMLAFNNQTYTPTAKPDIRQDTLWRDSLRIESITQTGYTHFLPDDIVLRAFTGTITDRFLIKNERNTAEYFSLFFSYGDNELPHLRGLNFNEQDAFIIEHTAKKDTISYWLRDTTLVNQDTLQVELTYMATDTTGMLRPQTDTLSILSKQPYEKRMKQLRKELEDWKKKQDKLKKKGQPYDSIMPSPKLEFDIRNADNLDPDRNIKFQFRTPLANIDTSMIHLYAKHDTLWYKAKMEFVKWEGDTAVPEKPQNSREYMLRGEWRPGVEYSLEIDSAAFIDIYGKASGKMKKGFKVGAADSYSTLLIDLSGTEGHQTVVELLDGQDRAVKQAVAKNNRVEFYYVKPGRYFLRMFFDDNGNGRWDTGDFEQGLQPEQVFYYHEPIECKEKWDITLEKPWNPTERTLDKQKPSEITKQKADKERKIQQRNAERARKLGIEYIPNN
ncbi:MAG: Ig-like domain-containing protein [Prevotella sp.]